MSLNKIMFVEHGYDGHNTWKCLACNAKIDAGYPSFDYTSETRIVDGCNYKFCPICGVKFEGIHQNSKIDKPKYYPFDTTERMIYRYNQLKWILKDRQRYRRERIEYFYEYRNNVAEFLDELSEYQCEDINFCKPRIQNRYR